MTSCAIAAIRRGAELRTLLWFGLFMCAYGARLLVASVHTLALAPGMTRWWDAADVVAAYLLLVPACQFWVQVSTGALRFFMKAVSLVALGVGVSGLGIFFVWGHGGTLLPLNHLLAISALVVISVVAAVPRLSEKFLLARNPVLAVALPLNSAVALYVNVGGLLDISTPRFLEPPAFVMFVGAVGYVAAQRVFSAERRLVSLENELQIAQRIQTSILPEAAPEMKRLRFAARYEPVSSVAGDFYDFLRVDEHRAGVLVADVSGHGVPAALIASMVKVALRSVAECAHNPAAVLTGLRRLLSSELRGQFITAAYLWLDTERGCALYSAAGHPPVLHWSGHDLNRVESNGLILGVPVDSAYPVREIPIRPGDRFVLYTDGLMEPENENGIAFGEQRAEEVIRAHAGDDPDQLARELLAEVDRWQPETGTREDDITLIVVEVC